MYILEGYIYLQFSQLQFLIQIEKVYETYRISRLFAFESYSFQALLSIVILKRNLKACTCIRKF